MLQRDQGKDETWQDWWNRHAADRMNESVVAVIKHRSIGKSTDAVELVSLDTSPDAQEIVVVGSILSRDGE